MTQKIVTSIQLCPDAQNSKNEKNTLHVKIDSVPINGYEPELISLNGSKLKEIYLDIINRGFINSNLIADLVYSLNYHACEKKYDIDDNENCLKNVTDKNAVKTIKKKILKLSNEAEKLDNYWLDMICLFFYSRDNNSTNVESVMQELIENPEFSRVIFKNNFQILFPLAYKEINDIYDPPSLLSINMCETLCKKIIKSINTLKVVENIRPISMSELPNKNVVTW